MPPPHAISPDVDYNPRARVVTYRSPFADTMTKTPKLPGSVAVISSGTADLAVAEECRIVAEHLGWVMVLLESMGWITSLEARRVSHEVWGNRAVHGTPGLHACVIWQVDGWAG